MPVFSALELENFKGYRDRVRIEWRQLSSIIGLNGVGKSTIPDAIEYVFCFPTYSSNKKTISNMRKDICNVEYLKSDDCPCTEVKVTLTRDEMEVTFKRSTNYQRNVHRYIIDDEEVSSKEYKNRLLEYNINSSANNFLVKQNCIEGIAIMSAKDRCEFFERSCNSIVYKSEYNRLKNEMKEACQAVEESKKDLRFYNKQLKKLRTLSKSVDKYEKLRTDLANVEFEYYFGTFLAIDKELDQTRKHKKELSVKIEVAEKIKKSYEERIAELKRSLENEESQARLDELRQKSSRYTRKRAQQQEIIAAQEERIKKLKAKLETARKHEAAREKTIRDLEQQLAEVKRQMDEEERLNSLSSSIQLDDEQYEEYLRLKSESIMFSAKENELKDFNLRERDIINSKIEIYQRQEKSLLDRISIGSSQVEKLKNDIAQTLKHCDSAESDIQTFSREIYELEVEIQNSNSKLESLNKEINELNAKIGESKYTAEMDRKARRKNEIFYKLQSRFSGVCERLKNLFEIADERYHVPITKIMGSKVDYILVDNDDTAQRCIYFLKEQYSGCSFNAVETFMPLSNIKVPDPQYVLAKIKDDPSVIMATSVVYPSQVAEKWGSNRIEGVLQSVLRNIVICKNSEIAMEYSSKKQIECVSMNGTLFKADGEFSGGLASLLKKSRVWNERDLENLKKQKESKMNEMREIVFELRNKKEKKNYIEIKLSGVQSRLKNYLQPSLAEQRNKLKIDEDHLLKLKKELSDFQDSSNIEELKLELKKIDAKLTEITIKIQAIEKGHYAAFCRKLKIDNIEQYVKGDFKQYKQRCERKKQICDHYYKIENQLNIEKNRFNELDVEKLEEEINLTEQIFLESKKVEVKFVEKIADVNRTIESLKRDQVGEKERKELKIKEKELNSVNNDLREWNSYVSSDDARIIRLEAKKHDMLLNCMEKNVDIPLHDSTIENIAISTKAIVNTESEGTNESENDSQLPEKYVAIDYSKLPKSMKKLKENTLNDYINNLQKKQTEISEQMKLIDINPKVNEEYESMKDKLKELESQHRQLLHNAAEIKGKFDEVKKQRMERFQSFFSCVADNIDRIFKELYRNDSAQALILAKSEEEPYLDGIDYQCIIPEKKFGLLEDFSGGEKTMAAIALLLAIYNAKPTSFLIFDEIDAALDYRNIARIGRYFIHLKPTTQVINISHQYQLSVFADAIVGVNFSPQRRTSYVIHFDLNDYQKNIEPDKCFLNVAEERLAALS